jgi:hypothetical protein
MENQIFGKIIEAQEMRSGVSQTSGKEWASRSYLLETMDAHPRHCLFDITGKERIETIGLKVGELVTVDLDIDARQYQGKWYNSIRVWRVERVQSNPRPKGEEPVTADGERSEPSPKSEEKPSESSPQLLLEAAVPTDDLPF